MIRYALASAALLVATPVLAQRGGDWTTAGNDAQRSGWARGDLRLTPEKIKRTPKPDFDLLWKLKVNSAPRSGQAVTPPALLDFYIGYRGFRTLGFFGGASNTMLAIDVDKGTLEWEKQLGAVGAPGTPQCPGGMTSSVTRPTGSGYPSAPAGRGRSTPAASGVGEPFEGAVTLKNVRPPQPFPPPAAQQARPPRNAAAAAAAAAAANPFSPRIQYAFGLTGDGKLHFLYVSNGDEPNPPIDFLPAGSHARGLIVMDGAAYAATVNGCGGAPNGIWSVNLESKKVVSWKAPANIAGTHGFAASPAGVIFAAAGSELFALDADTLTVKASFKAGAAFSSSPLVFEQQGKDHVAVATADGKVHIFDAGNLGAGPVASGDTGLGANANTGALASYTTADGARYFLAPGAAKIAALKLTGSSLAAGWMSPAMTSPLAPIVVNGIVFAVSAGKVGAPAVLHALDPSTGQPIWNSGRSILGRVTSGGLAAGGGRIYVSTADGVQYCFGVPLEL
ncbi:MAG: PQQ-binding-like beta-propeller repeat protein [Bryobacterales bacterium]|nr:PQQ-binding-like beta-propeller repeat protein [Bryobacterales bacterium]